MYKPNEPQNIVVPREEANYDRACDTAMHIACQMFGMDEYGNLTRVEGSERTYDTVVVELKRYRMYGGYMGRTHYYEFSAWVERNEDDT